MDPSKILEELFDRKTLTILRFLSANPDKQYYLREIAKSTRVPIATVFRITGRLTTLGIVDVIKIKRMKLYQYGTGKEGKFVEQLIETRKGAVEEFVELCRNIPNVQQIILHGRKLKDKANLLIIGEGIPSGPLVEAQAKIKEELDFTIISLTLNLEQYTQMVEMGLYAGERQVLFQQ